jgi:hypothetical protein
MQIECFGAETEVDMWGRCSSNSYRLGNGQLCQWGEQRNSLQQASGFTYCLRWQDNPRFNIVASFRAYVRNETDPIRLKDDLKWRAANTAWVPKPSDAADYKVRTRWQCQASFVKCDCLKAIQDNCLLHSIAENQSKGTTEIWLWLYLFDSVLSQSGQNVRYCVDRTRHWQSCRNALRGYKAIHQLRLKVWL